MKPQNNKLDFNTISLIELNEEHLVNIDGGFTPTLGWFMASYVISRDIFSK